MILAFNLLRVLTGLLAAAAFGFVLLIILLRSSLVFLKESAGVLVYVARLFTSGFTEGQAPNEPAGWIVSLPQAGLALLFVAMIVSIFLPDKKILLHSVSGLAVVAVFWYFRMAFTVPQLEILCVPALVSWFSYYAMCLLWNGNQIAALR